MTKPIRVPWPLHLHRRRPGHWLPRQGCGYYLVVGRYQVGLQWVPFQGIHLRSISWRPPNSWEVPGLIEQWEKPSMAIKKRATASQPGVQLAAVESEMFAGLMSLIEHCALRSYADGETREPGWFTVKTQGAAWIVQVKDPDTCSSFQAVAATPDKAFELAAALLASDDAPWEHDKWLADSKSRLKKK